MPRREGGQWRVVLDGREGKPYEAIAAESLRFSPDGRLAYVAQSAKKWLAVVDGREGKPYDTLGMLCFSPDGKRLAYRASAGGQMLVVLDGREQPGFTRIGDNTLVFSPDSRRLGYIARAGRASFVVVDGKRRPRYDMVGYLTFSPDGKHYVYAATKGEEAFTVVDDREAAHRYQSIWTRARGPPAVRRPPEVSLSGGERGEHAPGRRRAGISRQSSERHLPFVQENCLAGGLARRPNRPPLLVSSRVVDAVALGIVRPTSLSAVKLLG